MLTDLYETIIKITSAIHNALVDSEMEDLVFIAEMVPRFAVG